MQGIRAARTQQVDHLGAPVGVEHGNEQGRIAETVGCVYLRAEVKQRGSSGQGVFLSRKMKRRKSLAVGCIDEHTLGCQPSHLIRVISECCVVEGGTDRRDPRIPRFLGL